MNAVTVIPLNENDTRDSAWPLHLEAGTWRCNPSWNISEYHWLKCGEVIPEHSTCQVCGERK